MVAVIICGSVVGSSVVDSIVGSVVGSVGGGVGDGSSVVLKIRVVWHSIESGKVMQLFSVVVMGRLVEVVLLVCGSLQLGTLYT